MDTEQQSPANDSTPWIPFSIAGLGACIVIAALILRSGDSSVTIQSQKPIPVTVKQKPEPKPIGPLKPILEEIYER